MPKCSALKLSIVSLGSAIRGLDQEEEPFLVLQMVLMGPKGLVCLQTRPGLPGPLPSGLVGTPVTCGRLKVTFFHREAGDRH